MPVSSKMSPISILASCPGVRRNEYVPSTVLSEGIPRKIADWMTGSAGSAGQPPSARYWLRVIHSIVKPLGAPLWPATTSKWTVAVEERSDDNAGGSSSTGAANDREARRRTVALASKALRDLFIGMGAPEGMSCSDATGQGSPAAKRAWA